MNKSDSIATLAGALVKAQAEIRPAAMNATNPFLKNKYADLGSVTDAIKPVLASNELAYTQLVGGTPGVVELETVLMHSGGEWISTMIVFELGDEKGKSMAQVAGSVITYLRRYSLAAMFGVVSDEDTDGHAPAEKKSKPTPQATQQNGGRQQLDPDTLADMLSKKAQSYQGRTASKQQRGLLAGMMNAILMDDVSRHAVQEYLFGVTSLNDAADEMIVAALDWIKPAKDSGGAYKPDPLAEKETHATLRTVLKSQGQQELL